MKKSSLMLCIIAVALSPLVTVQAAGPVLNQPADPEDRFQVTAPAANASLRNTVEIKYTIFDDDQSILPLRIEILDPGCVQKIRTIVNSNQPSKTSQQIWGWNTKGTYTDGAALPDGTYCFSLCADMKQGASNYSVCNRRSITLRNTSNQPPRITSNPTTRIKQGGNYNYQITATDADGDPLAYKLTKKPSFLSLSGNTVKGSNIQQVGEFEVVIEVTDDFGGLARQSFKLTVEAATAQPQLPGPEGQQPGASFIYPKNNSTLAGKDNKIEWSLTNVSNIAKFQIDYRQVGTSSWNKLLELTGEQAAAQQTYTWDVSKLPAGKYELRVIITDKQGKTTEVVSSSFQVEGSDQGTTDINKILISEFIPAAGAAVSDIRPLIGAKISATDFGEINKSQISVKVAGRDITNACELVQDNAQQQIYNLRCALDQDLPTGENKVEVTINDNDSESKLSRDWSFVVVPGAGSEDDAVTILGVTLPRSTFNIILVILGVLLCLLLLPLLFLSVWRRRTRTTTTTKTTRSTTNTTPVGRTFDTESLYSTSASNPIFSDLDSIYNPAPANTSYQVNDAFSTKPADTTFTNLPPLASATETVTATTTVPQTPMQTSSQPTQGNQGNWFTRQINKVKDTLSPAVSPASAKPAAPITNVSVNNLPAPIVTNPVGGSTTQEPLAPASTASIMSGEYNIADTDASDNPVAPVSQPVPPVQNINIQNIVPAAPVPAAANDVQQPVQSQPQLVNQPPQQTDTDLPDWLKDANNIPAAPPESVEEPAKGSDPDGDGDSDPADPYGFGDYALGAPDDDKQN